MYCNGLVRAKGSTIMRHLLMVRDESTAIAGVLAEKADKRALG
jgi:hypothetical protein